MHNVSKAYKRAMDKQIRERGYIQIGLGAISLEAQGSADASANSYTYWSDTSNLFNNNENNTEYATFEQNFMKADGKLLFLPEADDYYFQNVGVATEALLGSIKIAFSASYPIKGLTVDFGEAYPVELKIITENDEFLFSNNSRVFVTMQNFGETAYIIIQPTQMVGGQQRLRIKNVLMGVGLTYGNADVASSSYSEFVSPISEEVSSTTFSATILDSKNEYNVDSSDSFINFLEIGQTVTVSMGATLEDGSVEWVKLCDLSLQSWNSTKGRFEINAVDKFAESNDKYTLGNRIYDRSAYTEIQSILYDMGLTPDDYVIDNYLATVTLHNPISEMTHKEALQLIANACRCVVYQDYKGRICIRANFALVLDPEDIAVDTEGSEERWSKPENVLVGSRDVYADYTQDFIKADGKYRFLPEDDTYMVTGYVSKAISNYNGLFSNNPKISLQYEAGTTFYGLHLGFDGNAPEKIKITTYLDGEQVDSFIYDDIAQDTYITYEFRRFDRVTFEFLKAYPNNRILINKISFGDFNDYKLKFSDMYTEPYGQRENPIKSISVKVFTYENETDREGNIKPKEVEDDVWYYLELNTVGENLEVSNPLIDTAYKASVLAEWLGNYYRNNVQYSVEYRGDARLNATDIIHMESRALNNLQVAIQENNLTFNGAWKGNLTMRKALRKGEE